MLHVFARAFQGYLLAKHSVWICWTFCSSKNSRQKCTRRKIDAARFARAFQGLFISKTFCLLLLDLLLEQNSRQKCPILQTIKSQRLGFFQSLQQPIIRPSGPLSSKQQPRVLGFMYFEDSWRFSITVQSRSSSKGSIVHIQFNGSLSKSFRGVRKAKQLEGLRIQDVAIMQGCDVRGFDK